MSNTPDPSEVQGAPLPGGKDLIGAPPAEEPASPEQPTSWDNGPDVPVAQPVMAIPVPIPPDDSIPMAVPVPGGFLLEAPLALPVKMPALELLAPPVAKPAEEEPPPAAPPAAEEAPLAAEEAPPPEEVVPP